MQTTRAALAVVAVAAAAAAVLALTQRTAVTDDNARVDALERQLADTAHRLQLVEDRNEIINLQRIYGYYLDKAMYTDLVDLFTDDVELEYSGRGVYVGRERARELMVVMPGGDGLEEGMLQNHIQIGGVVTVADDGQSARARWRALIMMGYPDGTGAWQEGTYENEYRKENGVWKISRIHAFINVNADRPEGFMNPGTMPRVDEDFPPDRPPTYRYDPYPAVFTPPFHYDHPVRDR